jgi:hypothetical protein
VLAACAGSIDREGKHTSRAKPLVPLRSMSNQTASIVPRRPREAIPPSSPLDPYVTVLLHWIEDREQPPNMNTLAKLAAADLDWPLPFTEAIVVAARTRRLLAMIQATARGGFTVGLSQRGIDWLTHVSNASRPMLES